MEAAIYPVILSGGAGTRLWPLSRELRPKQFISVHGEGTMFAQTVARVTAPAFRAPTIICNEDHRFLVAEELRTLNVTGDILLEPAARNTAPAIAVAAARIYAQDKDALMVVLPSDHVIADTTAFQEDLIHCAPSAAAGAIVTFGIQPTGPETGYGYIQMGDEIDNGVHNVVRFLEKPDAETAQRYLDEGACVWNAGIFMFKAATILSEFQEYEPALLAASEDALANATPDLDFMRLERTAFQRAPAVPIDTAVLEKTRKTVVYPLHNAWNDVGSWYSLWAMGEGDVDENVVVGRAALCESSGNYIRSDKAIVAALGIRDLIVVATDDAILVIPRDRAQELKSLVEAVRQADGEETHSHSQVFRPWGSYQVIDSGEGFLVKQLVVNPGAQLSLQLHEYRSEHWVVVEGVGRVTNGSETFDLQTNESTYIPMGVKHRLENMKTTPLRLIEVQTGEVISEKDIIRLEDRYGRAPQNPK